MGNTKGQAFLESLLILPLFIGGFSLLMTLIYTAALYFYTSYKLEEALLCALPREKAYSCQLDLQHSLSTALLFHENSEVHIAKSSSQIRGTVRVYFPLRCLAKEYWQQEQILLLPLEKNIL